MCYEVVVVCLFIFLMAWMVLPFLSFLKCFVSDEKFNYPEWSIQRISGLDDSGWWFIDNILLFIYIVLSSIAWVVSIPAVIFYCATISVRYMIRMNKKIDKVSK